MKLFDEIRIEDIYKVDGKLYTIEDIKFNKPMKIFLTLIFLISTISCSEMIKNPYTHNEDGEYFYYDKYEFITVGRKDTLTLYKVEEDLNIYRSLKDNSLIWKDKIVWERPGKKIITKSK
jgi:hypothetical protein